MLGLLGIILCIFLLFLIYHFMIHFVYQKCVKDKEQGLGKNKYPEPETHYVSSKSGAFKYTTSYSGDKRYIAGKPISTLDDLKEWYVLKDFSVAINDHLRDLEREMEDGKCENYAAAKAQWDLYYARLRELCFRHSLWNPALGDRAPFVPTNHQLALEKQLFQRISEKCETGVDKSFQVETMRKEILDYILSQPGRIAARREAVNALAGQDPERKKEYRQVCMQMVSDGILSETHDEKGRLLIRKRRAVKKKAEEVLWPAPEMFSSERFRDVDYQMLCKVKYTVGSPENMDYGGKRCEFHSLSSGALYRTSLGGCTCPAFGNGQRACKHMVALAKYLGYI